METFFMVMKDQAQSYVSTRHQSEINARLEAELLARKEVGSKFFFNEGRGLCKRRDAAGNLG